jgi:membrane fusion protein, heavy metal efflux system
LKPKLKLNWPLLAQIKLPRTRVRKQAMVAAAVVLVLSAAVMATTLAHRADKSADTEINPPARKVGNLYYPTPKQWASLVVEPVRKQVFRTEHLTEGKISVDEDKATLVYSPYAGRVVKLFAKPGDKVTAGQPLFAVESSDMVQAENDFITAIAGLNKAQAANNLAKIIEQQNKSLFATKAGPLRDLQQSEATLLATQNDLHAAQVALEAVRHRLRIFGKSDEEITKFSETGEISPLTTIYSPIAGTVVQRKVGPGQYVNTTSNSAAANDATFLVGDLSTVWLVAYTRESEAPNVHVGQALRFRVLAYPGQVFSANINYVATALDAATRRLLLRATIDNSQGLLRPEMFASVTILTGEGDLSPAVPRDAIIYDGNAARVLVVNDDKSIEQRPIKTGLTNGNDVEVVDGLRLGEKVVTKGSLFVDRAAAGS